MARTKRFRIVFREAFRGQAGRRHRMIFPAPTMDDAHKALQAWADKRRTTIYERIETVEVDLNGDPIDES